MHIETRQPLARVLLPYLVLVLCLAASPALPECALAQGLTGALIGTVKDDQGGAIDGALVRLTSPGLIGGPRTVTTDKTGQLRFLPFLRVSTFSTSQWWDSRRYMKKASALGQAPRWREQ